MGWERSWDFLGGPGSWPYRVFDAQRQRLNRRLVTYLLSHLGPLRDGVVLEAGSGPGYGSSLFAQHPDVRMSIALDRDPDALREARRRDPRLALVLGDLHHLPFRSGTCDLVWNSSTVEHLAQPDTAVQEMHRVAAPGGAVFIGVPYRGGPLGFQRAIPTSRFGIWIGPVFDGASLKRLMCATGLVPVEMVKYFFSCFIGLFCRKHPNNLIAAQPIIERSHDSLPAR